MGDLIKLVKGDANNLQGKVSVYSKLKEPKDGEHIFRVYVTTNPKDMFEKLEAPDSIMEKTKILETLIGQIHTASNKSGLEIVPAFGLHLPVESEEELLDSKEDVLFAGEYSHRIRCVDSVGDSAKIYMLNFEEQLQRKSDINLDIKGLMPKKSYLGAKNLADELTKNYVIPLADAVQYGSKAEAARLKAELHDYCMGSRFFSLVPDLIKTIEDKANPNRNTLISLNLNLIEAINAEKYEDAASINKDIKQIKSR
ncbi:MAG: hypothetical protein WC475_02965 [Candidatus Paceibacterota bacterium]